MNAYLFVIDYQNDFVDGSLGFPGAELLDEKIEERIKEYGKGRVFYTLDTHEDDYLSTQEGKHLPIPHCIKGTPGHDVYGKTAAALKKYGAVKIEKRSFPMDVSKKESRSLLPEHAEEIELCGLVSSICVLSNAVILKSVYPEAKITVDARLTAAADKKINEEALDILENLQINVINREK